jgi:hypothetical protein
MPADPPLVEPPSTLHRVERIAPPLSFNRINAIDAALDAAGNRFDVPGATVLYAATTASGAFTERAHDVLLQRDIAALDVAAVRGPSRLLTRGLATWIYSQTDARGRPRYGGIRYVSRLGDFECWAIFDGTTVEVIDEVSIEADDPALREVAELFRLDLN